MTFCSGRCGVVASGVGFPILLLLRRTVGEVAQERASTCVLSARVKRRRQEKERKGVYCANTYRTDFSRSSRTVSTTQPHSHPLPSEREHRLSLLRPSRAMPTRRGDAGPGSALALLRPRSPGHARRAPTGRGPAAASPGSSSGPAQLKPAGALQRHGRTSGGAGTITMTPARATSRCRIILTW